MCTMINILCYILLICAVTKSFANNEEKELQKNETDEISEENFEEEARNDIEHLLKNMVSNKNDSKTHNETEPKTNENNETLMDRLDHVLKQLGIKRRYIDKNTITVVDERLDNQFEWDKQDLSFTARHRDLMKNLASDHRDAVKNRMITKGFEDQKNSEKFFRFEQLMKNLDSNHINAVKSRVSGDNVIHRTFSNPVFDNAMQLPNNFKIRPAVYPKIVKYGDKMKVPKEQLRFTDLLNKYNNFYKFLKKIDVKQDEVSDLHMKISDKLHVDSNNQSHQLAKNFDIMHIGREESKAKGTDLRFTGEFLHSDNNKEMDALVDNLDITQTDTSYEHDMRTTAKLHSDYNDHLDQLMKKMYSNSKVDSTETAENNITIDDTLNPNNNNQSHNIVKDLDVNNGDESTANVSSNTLVDMTSNNVSDSNNNDLEYRPVIEINEYVNKSTATGKSVKNYDMSDTNNHLSLLMKNLVIKDRHDKQKIMVNLKQNTENMQNHVKKMGQSYRSVLENNDDSNFIAEASYRVQSNMNNFNNANIPTSINLGRPVYQRLVPTTPRAVSKERHGSRAKRSTFTQAGYTQDPDTCKTYNENLVKLWSNLSKFINVTEQPNEKALHNIAVMIQAYLDHQNIKSTPETNKVKHEGSRDKLTDVILKIKKLFDETDATPEKVTKIITKYLKPFYGDVENAECQQVNEESLGSSVELLYKNYLENAECHHDGEGTVRNKENLRRRTTKNIKTLSSNWHSSNSEYKPEIKSILSEDELYKDFHRGKMPRQRPTSKFRRVYKRSRYLNSSSYRSGDQNINDSEKLKVRSKTAQKTSNKKLKKNSLKTDVVKGKCEKYAIRKFAVSLRPVIERYMALLECQLDNTLRSLNYDRVSKDPYYLYASKFYSNEDNLRQKKLLRNTKLTRKNTGRSRNISPRKSEIIKQYDTSDDKNIYERIDEINYPRLRKYSLKEIAGNNSPSSVPNSSTELKKSNIKGNNEFSNYFLSPPMYDDYDGVYKMQSDSSFPSHINPLTIVNDNRNAGDGPTNKYLIPSINEESNENPIIITHNMFYEEEFPEESIPLSDISDQQTDPSNTFVSGFTDLTKLRDFEEITDSHRVQSPTALKNNETITDFLKKARDVSLQTPEFALPFALDSNKGYVELTHLVKYPKIIVYRPQFIVKNTMPYDDFLKTINNINMTNDEVRLMKIVRHLPDNTIKVLFETEDFESPLEVLNINNNRRSSLPITVVESRIDTTMKNNKYGNAGFNNDDIGESVSIYRDEVHSNIVDTFLKSAISREDENGSHYAPNSTIASAKNTPFSSSFSSGLIPSLASGLIPNIASGFLPGLDSGLVPSSVTAISSKLGASIGKGLDTALSLGSALKGSPIHPSQLSSYIKKLIPSYLNSQLKIQSNVNKHSGSETQINSNTQLYSNRQPKSHSHSQSHSNSHLPSLSNSNSHISPLSNSNSHLSSLSNSNPKLVPNRNPKFENAYPSTTPSSVNRWWKRWKNTFKGKIKVKNNTRHKYIEDNSDYESVKQVEAPHQEDG